MSTKVSALYESFGWLINSTGRDSILSLKEKEILELLKTGGVVLFRGFDVDKDKFIEFSKRFSGDAIRHINPKARPAASDDGTVTEVLLGNHEIELHGEMYYLPRRPEFLWLYCITPSRDRGATTLCSGSEFLSALKPETRRYLSEHRVKYNSYFPPESWRAFSPDGIPEVALATLKAFAGVQNIRHDTKTNFISFDFVTSAITKSKFGKDVFINSILNTRQYEVIWDQQGKTKLNSVSLESGEPIPENVLNDIKAAGERIIKPVIWQKDDLVVIENSSVMHGRQSFTGERKILTRFTMAA